MTTDDKPKKPRGFAAMSEEKRRAIQSMGGKASPRNFANSHKLAVELGRKGGKAERKPRDA